MVEKNDNHAAEGMLDAPEVSDRMVFHGVVPQSGDVLSVLELGEALTLRSDRKGNFLHELAKQHLELPEFIVNDSLVDRNLRDTHVTYLINCMKAGTFRWEWVNIITCVCREAVTASDALVHPPGTRFRMNGQHTAWARLAMPERDYAAPVRIMEYEAKSVADMRRLYASIDRNAPRQRGNVIDSYLAGCDEYKGYSRGLIRSLVYGMSFWLFPDQRERTHKAPEDLVVLIQSTHQDVARKVGDFLTERVKGGLKRMRSIMERQAVVAAMFETFNKLPSKAHEFWVPVRDGVDFDGAGDPRKRLHDSLREHNVINSGAFAKTREQVGAEEMYRWSIYAWNKWRAGESQNQVLQARMNAPRPRAK